MSSLSDANFRYMGFCGVDDSVSPQFLHLLSAAYPWIEWGMLFRSDLEGQPRYPTWEWTLSMAKPNTNGTMKLNLAGHLCANRCQEVLNGDFTFVDTLSMIGIQRIQINATAANAVSVDETRFPEYVENMLKCAHSYPNMEWILQYNDETKKIWDPLLESLSDTSPRNIVLLFDASCGTGIRMTEFPSPYLYKYITSSGYAGGIGPNCIDEILQCVITTTTNNKPTITTIAEKDIAESSGTVTTDTIDKSSSVDVSIPAAVTASSAHRGVWIDMESSLRTLIVTDKTTGTTRDVFAVDKCFDCISAGLRYGLQSKVQL
mmetsp:Transcript_8694/g.12099  ORF Transcript_8694/g.12099 Transcript_8694/m.12099 type:complete len:318 (+) Transcript_8694:115-1068(+)